MQSKIRQNGCWETSVFGNLSLPEAKVLTDPSKISPCSLGIDQSQKWGSFNGGYRVKIRTKYSLWVMILPYF